MKRISSILILVSLVLFAASLAQAQDDKPPYYLTDEALDNLLSVDKQAAAPKKFVWVVYFHRTPGCATCQLMSKYVLEIAKTKFAEDVKSKDIMLRYRNFEEPKNAELVKKLNVKSPSLAILVAEDGKLVKAKLAGQIWSLAAEKEKFFDYVTKEIDSYKKETVKK